MTPHRPISREQIRAIFAAQRGQRLKGKQPPHSSFPKENKGLVYLLKFDKPLAHSSHYIGYTQNLPKRLAHHASGKSDSAIMRAIHQQGIGFKLVRLWVGDRKFERQLKSRHGASRMVPQAPSSKKTQIHFKFKLANTRSNP